MEHISTKFYQERIQTLSIELEKYARLAQIWIAVRLFSFLLLVVYAYILFPYNWAIGLGLIALFIIFLFFVRKSQENKEKLNFIKVCIQLNANEIAAAEGDYTAFDGGDEFKNSQHPFSFDMDIFGHKSFFQFFNRTATSKGKKMLAKRLLHGTKDVKASIDAIAELKENGVWCEAYIGYGKLFEKEATNVNLEEVLQEEVVSAKWMKIAQYLFPLVAFIISLAYYFNFISGVQFVIGFILIMLPVQQSLKSSNRLHKSLLHVKNRIGAMRQQFTILQKETFSSSLLSGFHEQLFNKENSGKKGLEELYKLIKETEYRDNILVSIFLNFFLAWDFRLRNKFLKWKATYAKDVAFWEKTVYEIEVLISGANFRRNFEEFTTVPQLINEDEGLISIVDMGHPLIPLDKIIVNDFSLTAEEQFAIITGPNMAGKSTFLRSIGVNLMLAQAGFHVFAKEFAFPNYKLYSSMRTSDDLKEETSYFHAELLRLRFIVDAIERGEKVFIILDEILKGTNSKDKEEGSAKFLQKLNHLGAKGIIATHDLSLTELAKIDKRIVNKFFDTKIEGDEISFNYKIGEGVAKNMNASFLLKKMKLTD